MVLVLDPQKDALHPQTTPLKTISDLVNWEPRDPFNVSSIPFLPRPTVNAASKNEQTQMRVLVAHDMAGGYHQDRFVQGCNEKDLYNIQYWSLVDTFIYFSHSLVSIPPPGWVNACHRNNVAVLLNVITEWDPGMEACLKLIYGPDYEQDGDNEPKREKIFNPFLADKLVDIAEYYCLDGIFFNIENKLPSYKDVSVFIEFLSYIREKLHRVIPHSKVIWYDSVTVGGDLHWQNKLTTLNLPFLNACDGIFLNYTWKETYPFETLDLLNKASNYNKQVRDDVYVGIDVWGRGQFGGGGWNCHKALRVIEKAGLQAAIFAPAWTYEHLGKEKFEVNERRFWLDTKALPDLKGVDEGDLGCIASFVQPRANGSQTSFYSNFCRGFGNSLFIDGKVVLNHPWANLSTQSINPLPKAYSVKSQTNNSVTVRHDVDNAWFGGSSFCVEGIVESSPVVLGLFTCALECQESTTFELVVYETQRNEDVLLAAFIRFSDESFTILHLKEVANYANDWKRMQLSLTDAQSKVATQIGIAIVRKDWKVTLDAPLIPLELSEANESGQNSFGFQLGEYYIHDAKTDFARPEDKLILKLEDTVFSNNGHVSATISWLQPNATNYVDRHFEVYGNWSTENEWTFLGFAYANRFRMSGLGVDGRKGEALTIDIKIRVVACGRELSCSENTFILE